MRNDTSAEGYILMAASIFACNHIVNCKLHCHEIEKSYLLPVRACRADRACGFGDVRLFRRRRGFRRFGRRFSVARDSGRTDRSGSHSRRKRRICLYGKRPADRRRAACGADDLSPGTCLGEYLLCRGGYPDRTVGVGRRDRVSGAVGTVLYGRGAVVRRRAARGGRVRPMESGYGRRNRENRLLSRRVRRGGCAVGSDLAE